MSERVTITLDEQVIRWAERKAAEGHTSVSILVGRLLSEQMQADDDAYWRAFEQWKTIDGIAGINAASRLSRDEAHARR